MLKSKNKKEEEYNTDDKNGDSNHEKKNNYDIENQKQIPEGKKLKIFNWNVNGIRAFKPKGTLDKLIKEGK
jgi:hypothetical protein